MLELALVAALVFSAPGSAPDEVLPPSTPKAVEAPPAQELPPPLDSPVLAPRRPAAAPRAASQVRLLSPLELEELRLHREELLDQKPGLAAPIVFLGVSVGAGVLAGVVAPSAFAPASPYGQNNIPGMMLFAALAVTHLIFGTVGAINLSRRAVERAEIDDRVAQLDARLATTAVQLPEAPEPVPGSLLAPPAGL